MRGRAGQSTRSRGKRMYLHARLLGLAKDVRLRIILAAFVGMLAVSAGIARLAVVPSDMLVGTIGKISADRLQRVWLTLVQWIGHAYGMPNRHLFLWHLGEKISRVSTLK